MAAFSALALAAALSSTPHQPPNSRCEGSPFLTGDIFTAPGEREAVIKEIAVLRDRQRRVVGFLYNMPSERFVQALPSMSAADRSAVGVQLANGDRWSGLTLIQYNGNPWPDLSIHYCQAQEMVSGRYSRSPY